MTAIANPDPDRYAQDALRECPDFAAAATPAQLRGFEGHVLLVCAVLGEIMLSNQCWVKLVPRIPDPTSNVKLQVRGAIAIQCRCLTASLAHAHADGAAMLPDRLHSLHNPDRKVTIFLQTVSRSEATARVGELQKIVRANFAQDIQHLQPIMLHELTASSNCELVDFPVWIFI